MKGKFVSQMEDHHLEKILQRFENELKEKFEVFIWIEEEICEEDYFSLMKKSHFKSKKKTSISNEGKVRWQMEGVIEEFGNWFDEYWMTVIYFDLITQSEDPEWLCELKS